MTTIDEDRKLAHDFLAYRNADVRAVTDALYARLDEVEKLRKLLTRALAYVPDSDEDLSKEISGELEKQS